MRIRPYCYYMIGMALFVGLILLTPYLALRGIGLSGSLYGAGEYICHQKISRSLCLFEGRDGGLSVSDCLPQAGEYRQDRRSELCVGEEGRAGTRCEFGATGACGMDGVCNMQFGTGKIGYKFPVSARDLLIYVGMLAGGALLPFLWKIESKKIPNKWLLVLFLLPMAIDGATQYLGWRESTNLLRAMTGFLAGVIVPFYLVPMLNGVWDRLGWKR